MGLLHRVHFTALLVVAVLLRHNASVAAEPPIRQRAVDVYSLTDGSRLLGVSMNAVKGESATVLVSASWLRKELPDLHAHLTQVADMPEERVDTLTLRLEEHLEGLRAAEPKEIERIGFLHERLTDLTANQRQEATYDLIVVTISPSLVRRQFLQKPEVQRVGGLALLNGISDVESKAATELETALKELAAKSPLRANLPESLNDSGDDDFLRLLVASEYSFGETCRLIQHGGQFIAADGEGLNIDKLLPEMLQGQLQAQLGSLLGEAMPKSSDVAAPNNSGTLDPKAVSMANGFRLVEVSHMDLNTATGVATVHLDLYFKSPEASEFRHVKTIMGKAGPSDVSAEKMQAIRNDPRVKQVTQIFGALGSGAGDLTKALGIGAAVEVAQNKAKTQLSDYLLNSTEAGGSEIKVLRAKLTELPAVRTTE